jgi:hypothetical protein
MPAGVAQKSSEDIFIASGESDQVSTGVDSCSLQQTVVEFCSNLFAN